MLTGLLAESTATPEYSESAVDCPWRLRINAIHFSYNERPTL